MPQFSITNNSSTTKTLILNGQEIPYPPFAQNTYTLDSAPTLPSYFVVIRLDSQVTPPPPVVVVPPDSSVTTYSPKTILLTNVSTYDAAHSFAYLPRVSLVDALGEEIETDFTHGVGHVYLNFPNPFTGTLTLG